jgi:hypothetical protein
MIILNPPVHTTLPALVQLALANLSFHLMERHPRPGRFLSQVSNFHELLLAL